jgi:hypothetical protein
MTHQLEGDLTMERRMAERKEFTKTLDFKVSTLESGTVTCGSQGVDISSYGLGMMSDYRPERGMILQISVPVEDIGITLPLFAEVTWVSPVREGFKAGLSFLL